VKEITSIVSSCDHFVSLVPWHSRSLDRLRRELKPGKSIGFFDCYDVHVPLNYGKHSAHLAFDIVSALDRSLSFMNFTEPLTLPCTDLEAARRLKGMLPAKSRMLVIHNETAPTKMWSFSQMRDAIDGLLDEQPDVYAFILAADRQNYP